MKIIWFTIAIGLLILAGYLIALIMTMDNLVGNALEMYGIENKELGKQAVESTLYLIALLTSILIATLLLHVGRAIRRREGVW